jgi:ribosomal protein S18 acetylase RimI-like enzyme
MLSSRRRRFPLQRLVVAIATGLLNVFMVLYFEESVSHALVVTSPSWQEENTQRLRTGGREGNQHNSIIVQPKLILRIRSTASEDIPMVSTILTHALLEETDTPHKQPQLSFNFKKQMEFLRTKSGVASLLHSRMDAMITGTKLWQSISNNPPIDDDILDDTHKLRYLWSSEIFRNKLEKACKLSNEPHSWKGYNFACAPPRTDKLFHKMMTAENIATGEIIGFCELAMLYQPTHWNSKEDVSYRTLQNEKASDMVAIPTIVNLVTSVEYRRRGIASSILRSASRYVQLKGCSNELALYVEQKNNGALRVYEKLGYNTAIEHSNQLYMKADISKQRTEERKEIMMPH